MKFRTRRINNNISRKIGDDLSRFTRITIIYLVFYDEHIELVGDTSKRKLELTVVYKVSRKIGDGLPGFPL